MPKYIKYRCDSQHFGYTCKGHEHCEQSLGVLVCFLSELKHHAIEVFQSRNVYIHVLISDEILMTNLKRSTSQCSGGLQFLHPRKFQGCTGDSIITVNVEDTWLLESVSSCAMNPAVIDN